MHDMQLIEAVKAGDLATVEALLTSGVTIHQQDEQGWSSLSWAAGKGDVALIRLLLKHGADVTHVGHDQRTPYMIALAAARIEAARLLREAAAQASGISDCSQQLQKYCKAYYLKELRQFPVWCESRINWQDQAQADMPPAQDGDPLSENEVVFIHHDLTVTQSMWHNEHVIFNQITPAWEAFCAQVLHFKVPDDFDLVGEPL